MLRLLLNLVKYPAEKTPGSKLSKVLYLMWFGAIQDRVREYAALFAGTIPRLIHRVNRIGRNCDHWRIGRHVLNDLDGVQDRAGLGGTGIAWEILSPHPSGP